MPSEGMDHTNTLGQTALTPQLAKLVPGDLVRTDRRLGMERTDWADNFGKPKAVRTVLVDAESAPGEWTIGINAEERPARRRHPISVS